MSCGKKVNTRDHMQAKRLNGSTSSHPANLTSESRSASAETRYGRKVNTKVIEQGGLNGSQIKEDESSKCGLKDHQPSKSTTSPPNNKNWDQFTTSARTVVVMQLSICGVKNPIWAMNTYWEQIQPRWKTKFRTSWTAAISITLKRTLQLRWVTTNMKENTVLWILLPEIIFGRSASMKKTVRMRKLTG